ncbi:leucine-rich repeat-containing protein 14 [Turdus rufiventris]|nr:leucine-rich repeat-containing protein 14 [Turdus rufiventris]
MDSLLLLCARRVVTQNRLPPLPADLYPILFQLAFLDGRPCVLRDLVAAWPFPVLHVQQLVRHRELLGDHPRIDYVQAIIQAVVAQLQREMDEPSSDSRFRLRVVDMIGVSDYPDNESSCSRTVVLAKACVEVSKHQQELQRHRTNGHTGFSGAMTDLASPQLLGVDVHADLVVDGKSYQILHDALQTGTAGPLRLKCRTFRAQFLSGSQIVTLSESLDPSCLRRVDLGCIYFRSTGLSVILWHLLRFPELRSLKLFYITMDELHPTSESATGIHDVARQLGMLPGLQELRLQSARLPGYLPQILW